MGPTSFADELAARIKGDTTSKPEADRTCRFTSLPIVSLNVQINVNSSFI